MQEPGSMETKLSSAAPARLYALLLKIRPLQQGTLMPFSGELVHAAFLKWLTHAAPDVAAWLHEGQKRRLFTCSSLHFPRSTQRFLHAEQENIHLPLDPDKTYTLRLTLLLGDLFPLFYNALMSVHVSQPDGSSPFLRLGKQLFLLEEILLTNDDTAGWAGFTSLSTLIEQARTLSSGSPASLTLEFASLTTFNRGTSRNSNYGSYPSLFPLPHLVFSNLLRRWEDIAPAELAPLIQGERIEQYLEGDGIIVTDYELKAHHVHFTTHMQRGFVGSCTYQLRGPDEKSRSETALTIRQQIALLAQIAFYTGVGYKTAMGLGQARVIS